MFSKNGSNKKGLYAILMIAFTILAFTACSAYNVVLAKEKPAKISTEEHNEKLGVSNKPKRSPANPDNSVFDEVDPQTGTAAPVAESTAENEAAVPETETTAPVTEATVENNSAAAVEDTTPVTHDYSILIKKSTFQCSVLDNGKVIETYQCALGKNTGDKERSGDMKTPVGTFKVIEVCDASYWTHDFHDGKGEIPGAYGPWFFYLDTNEKSKGQWDGIGIHGTHDNSSIGKLISEGCIRLTNENILTLKEKYIKVGTWVTIEE